VRVDASRCTAAAWAIGRCARGSGSQDEMRFVDLHIRNRKARKEKRQRVGRYRHKGLQNDISTEPCSIPSRKPFYSSTEDDGEPNYLTDSRELSIWRKRHENVTTNVTSSVIATSHGMLLLAYDRFQSGEVAGATRRHGCSRGYAVATFWPSPQPLSPWRGRGAGVRASA
jgi:hypothetical protein